MSEAIFPLALCSATFIALALLGVLAVIGGAKAERAWREYHEEEGDEGAVHELW